MSGLLLVHNMPWWRALPELIIYGSPMVKLMFGGLLFACGLFAHAGVRHLWLWVKRRPDCLTFRYKGRRIVRWVLGVALILVILLTPLWLLRITDSGNGMVQNGLQQFTICGKARAPEGADPMSSPLATRVMDATGKGTGRGSRMGVWGIEKQGGCHTFVHGPPGAD